MHQNKNSIENGSPQLPAKCTQLLTLLIGQIERIIMFVIIVQNYILLSLTIISIKYKCIEVGILPLWSDGSFLGGWETLHSSVS